MEPTGFTLGEQHPEQRPQDLEDILRKGFSTGVSYMSSSLFEVSQWCNAVDLLGKRRKITLISCFGEISGSRGMERNIFYLISKSSYSTSSNAEWGITCRNDIMQSMFHTAKEALFFNLIMTWSFGRDYFSIRIVE